VIGVRERRCDRGPSRISTARWPLAQTPTVFRSLAGADLVHDDISAIVRQTASAKGSRMADQRQAFVTALGGTIDDGTYLVDIAHPNQAGHQLIESTLAAVVGLP
jgi:hypothetical protein